ncbi:MAG: hypothetical protein ABI880_09675 [Acidobacteriota bacterium]
MPRRAFVLALALVAATFSPAFAHEGHDHKLTGTLTEVSAGKIVVKEVKDGAIATVTLSTATRITRGKTALKAADLKVGDRVVVNVGAGKTPLAAKTVQVGAASNTR